MCLEGAATNLVALENEGAVVLSRCIDAHGQTRGTSADDDNVPDFLHIDIPQRGHMYRTKKRVSDYGASV